MITFLLLKRLRSISFLNFETFLVNMFWLVMYYFSHASQSNEYRPCITYRAGEPYLPELCHVIKESKDFFVKKSENR